MSTDSTFLIACVIGVVLMNFLISRSKKSQKALRDRKRKIKERYNDTDDGDVA